MAGDGGNTPHPPPEGRAGVEALLREFPARRGLALRLEAELRGRHGDGFRLDDVGDFDELPVRHLSSFLGLARTPHASGDMSRNKGISKAGCKLARSTLVELAWSWLRYQHDSALALWWRARFSKRGMRIRNIGIVALARKLAVAFWQFIEDGQVPKGAVLKA